MSLTVKVIDYSDYNNIRTETVTLPDVPRQGDNFKWTSEGATRAIQNVIWNGDETDGGVEIAVG